MQRKSARLAGTVAKRDIEDEANADALDEDDYLERPAKKRNKSFKSSVLEDEQAEEKEKKGKTKRQGKLAMLPDMPLDVLYEIFGHLPPYDLLRASRTTKAFRSLLLSRSSKFVWIAALNRTSGLPPCPTDLSEPRYTRLAFEHVCHVCGAPNIRDVQWTLRLRVCKKCVENRDFFFERYYHSDSQELVCWSSRLGKKRFNPFLCIAKDFTKMRDILAAFGDDQKGRASFIAERTLHLRAVKDHAEMCQTWYDNLRSEQSDEIDGARLQRREAIEARLSELGFAKELVWLKHYRNWRMQKTFHFHKYVRQPKALTERMWTNMKSTMVDLMNEVRSVKTNQAWRAALWARGRILEEELHNYELEHLGDGLPLPSVTDLYLASPDFKAILDTPLTEEDEDTITAADFRPALQRLSECANNWRRACLLSLVALLPASKGPTQGSKIADESNADRLLLATSVFSCPSCSLEASGMKRTFSAMNLLWHPCCNQYLEYRTALDNDEPNRAHYESFRRIPWNLGGNRIHFYSEASEKARYVVSLCGLDPDMATADNMDKLNARLTCRLECCTMDQRWVGMSWRQTLNHACPVEGLEVLKPAKRDKIIRSEFNVLPTIQHTSFLPGTQDPRRAWRCVRCHEGQIAWCSLAQHMRDKHTVYELQHADYGPDMDRFAPATHPIWVLSAEGSMDV